MNLPPSSLLGRLEAFLPEMEKANQTTEKLVKEGKLEVLDTNLEVAGTDQQGEETEEADEEEATGEVHQEEEDGAGPGAAPPSRTVQLVSAAFCMCTAVARGGSQGHSTHGGLCFVLMLPNV